MNIKFCLATLILLFPATQMCINVSENRRSLFALGACAAVVGYVAYKYYYNNLEHDDDYNENISLSDVTRSNNYVNQSSEQEDTDDIKIENKLTALRQAILDRSASEVEKLLQNGAASEIIDNVWDHPLHLAVLYASAEIVELLLKYGVNIEARRRWDQSTALHNAVEYNQLKIVEILLARGANFNVENIDGITPWRIAFTLKNPEIIKTMLLHGADVDILAEYGITKLHTAVALNLFEVVQTLIASQIDVNAKSDDGITPLHFAAHACNSKIVKELLIHGARVHARDKNGNTPLHLVVLSCDYKKDIIPTLIEYGASVHMKNNKGDTPLHLAASRFDVDSKNIV